MIPPVTAVDPMGLQERAARAVPSEAVETDGGWWLRYAPGTTWWSGTVLPHTAAHAAHRASARDTSGHDALAARVERAERFFAARGVPARFQITPGACPEGLDAFLAGRGYRWAYPAELRAAAASEVQGCASPGPLRVEAVERPTAEWFDVWRAVHGDTGAPWSEGSAREWAMLGRVEPPSTHVCAYSGGRAVAVGRAVAEGVWAGVFSMGTLPDARGTGAARQVLTELATWSLRQGADRMYLQVEKGNEAAIKLYTKAGFREVCTYHYRFAD